MSLILDTHTAIWYVLQDSQLSRNANMAIENEPDFVYISPASYWEIAIKINKGTYRLLTPFEQFWNSALAQNGLRALPISIAHAAKLTTLPLIHKDPFDRMIAAQSLVENLSVVSCDAILDGYNIRRIW